MRCIIKLNGVLNKNRSRAGLDIVPWELIGSLWFAIGGFHVSDRLSHPCARKHIRKVVAREGEVILIKHMHRSII